MIACHCKGTTDSTIRKAIRDGATTLYQVGMACEAGTCCGGCHSTIEKILRAQLREHEIPIHINAPIPAAAG